MGVHDLQFKRPRENAFVRDVGGLKADIQNFMLSPTLWSAFPGCGPLVWAEVAFEKKHRKHIPKKRGVYCFMVTPMAKPTLPLAIFPIYIGETGNKSDQNLRARFGQYLREAEVMKRPHVFYALNKWRGHIRFSYAVVPDRRRSLTKIEAYLNTALVPPYSHEDFVATFRPKVGVLRKT